MQHTGEHNRRDEMKLNNRLMMITKQIPQCNILADIGTDHAFIPIYAVKHEICAKALAADLREGPLNIAHDNIKKHKLENLCFFVIQY